MSTQIIIDIQNQIIILINFERHLLYSYIFFLKKITSTSTYILNYSIIKERKL